MVTPQKYLIDRVRIWSLQYEVLFLRIKGSKIFSSMCAKGYSSHFGTKADIHTQSPCSILSISAMED
jgi:hypothetical protein